MPIDEIVRSTQVLTVDNSNPTKRSNTIVHIMKVTVAVAFPSFLYIDYTFFTYNELSKTKLAQMSINCLPAYSAKSLFEKARCEPTTAYALEAP